MSLNNFQRIFSIILIAFPSLYGQVQDTTATVPPPETVINSPPEQINETATDNADQQDSEPQVASEEPIVYLSPKGKKLDQTYAKKMLDNNINIICGHFEGVDQRLLETRNIEEVSVGDFVLSGGEIGAFVVIDAIVRLIPGVLGNPSSLSEETFERNLLEYPQYTKPQKWEKKEVPDVLLTGDHAKIKDWRLAQSRDITRRRRPDLWKKHKKEK